MAEMTDKEKILLTLILLVPFCLLVTGNPLIQVLLVFYSGFLIYLVIDRKFLISLKLPPIGEQEWNEETKAEVLPGLKDVRRAEANIHKDIKKIKTILKPEQKPKSKPRRKTK